MKYGKSLFWRRAGLFGLILLLAALVLGGFPVRAHAEEEKVMIRIFPGNRGSLVGGDPLELELPKSDKTYYSLPAVEYVDERYYVKGLRESGTDNLMTSYTADSDRSFVVAYGDLDGRTEYVVRHLEYGTNKVLAPEQTFYANAGDKLFPSCVNIEGYMVYQNIMQTVEDDEERNVFTTYYTIENYNEENGKRDEPFGPPEGNGGEGSSPVPYDDPNPGGKDLAYRGPALNQAKKPTPERPTKLFIGGKETAFRLIGVSDADALGEAEREVFLASYEAIKTVRNKIVKYFFWLMPDGATLADGQTAEFSFYCEGKGVEATMNGSPVPVVACAEPKAYIVKLTEFGALAILCDAE